MSEISNIEGTTICACATGNASGAVAVVRISGPETFNILTKIFKPKRDADVRQLPGYSLLYGEIHEQDGTILDDVLVSIFKAPHSYTGEDSAEISCHGSHYIVQSLLSLLVEHGATYAAGGDFTKRAFLNGKMDLAQAEAVCDLIASETEASHNVAMKQMRGGFSKELEQMRTNLLQIVSLLELELDFSEEEVQFADRKELQKLLDDSCSQINSLISSFKLGNAIKNGVPVAIVGATNTGKSTLLNAMLGEDRAIVSSIAGTTRDTIEDNVNIGGSLFRFIDTAGIRHTTQTIEMMGIERTWKKFRESSVIILMLDATREDAISPSLSSVAEKFDSKKQQLIVIANKTDRISLSQAEALEDLVREACKKLKLKPQGLISTSLKKEPESSRKQIETILTNIGKGFCADIQCKTYVTNLRHYQALKDAQSSVERVFAGIDSNLPTDLLAQDLREATDSLGSIIGEISSQDVLSNIFSHFCIGK